MACICAHANRHIEFPVFGPQPTGPSDRWPVYFVPDASDPGAGHYYCPRCHDGLVEARANAGMPKLEEDTPPLSWLELGQKYMTSCLEAIVRILPQSTAGESR